jgi:hypothetical protein
LEDEIMKKYLLTVDSEIYKAFRESARKEGRTMKWLLEQFMLQYVGKSHSRKAQTKLEG